MNPTKKPVILTVDDEVQVSNAIERDLRQHYHQFGKGCPGTGPHVQPGRRYGHRIGA